MRTTSLVVDDREELLLEKLKEAIPCKTFSQVYRIAIADLAKKILPENMPSEIIKSDPRLKEND